MSIYNFAINSLEDVDEALTCFERNKNQIETVQNSRQTYNAYNTQEFEKNLYIRNLFKSSYWGAQDHSIRLKVVTAVKDYHELLSKSITVCTDLAPLIIQLLTQHQMALNDYARTQEQPPVLAEMSEIQKIAKKIADTYKTVSEQIETYKEQIVEISSHLVNEQTWVATNQRQLKEEKLPSDSFEEPVLQMDITSWDTPIESLRKIVTALENFCHFVSTLVSHIKKLGDNEIFTNPYLFENYSNNNSIQDELDRSYFNWLVLAKVNLVTVSILRRSFFKHIGSAVIPRDMECLGSAHKVRSRFSIFEN